MTVIGTCLAFLRSVRRPRVELDDTSLHITVMKPMSGKDPRLEENLESFARLKAPACFEVLMCLGSVNDAAYPIALRMLHKYPYRFRLVTGSMPGFGNAKMAQLLYAWPHARNPFIWVSESNVETSQGFMEALAKTWKEVNASGRVKTLIHAPLVGVYGSGWGASFERMHLASLQNPNHELGLIRGMHAVVGKTEFFHREDMEALGGLERFANYLGEDFLMGVTFAQEGRVRCIGTATRNVLGPLTVRAWFDRHARWAVMRKTLVPGTFYLLEPTINLGLPALMWLVGLIPAWWLLTLLAVRMAVDAVNYWIQARVPPSLLDVALVPVKEFLLFVAWVQSLTTFHVMWKADRAIQLGPQSVVLSTSADPSKLSRSVQALRRVMGRWA